MNPGIFLINDKDELVEMNEQVYNSEKLLQDWLAKYPDLLVGNQIDSQTPRRWLFIEGECSVPSEEGGAGRWAIDHLFLDQDAIPTIVEVKRSVDTRIRREVVGQMLDYAANATAHWPVAYMRERFAANCERGNVDPEERLKDFLGDEIDPESFWENADRNLKARKLRLLFVADVIPPELQRIVEFLNDQMDQTEVLAIEIKQFVSEGGLRSLVPRVIGQTAKAQQAKASGPRVERQWDEASVLQLIEEKRGPAEAEAARELIQWSKEHASHLNWGKGANDGSFSPVFDFKADYFFIPFIVYTYGKAEIMFRRMKMRHPPFDADEKRLELLQRLNQIPNVSLPEDGIARRPSVPLSALTNQEALTEFLKIIEWTVDEVRGSQPL
ncbi:MAG TPA: hypothetical protein VIT88_00915 [Pyrinomonadaceae bacterium]